MRTHLLRTFYPSPEIEFDTGNAANDDHFASGSGSREAQARSNADECGIAANSLHDKYVLGGYAGI